MGGSPGALPADPVFALFRFFFGVLFAFHGAQKVFGLFGMPHAATGVPLVAGVIELVAGPLIATGLFAAVAAFIASGEMAVAYFMGHAPHGFLPIVNHGEPAILYCFAFLLDDRGPRRRTVEPGRACSGPGQRASDAICAAAPVARARLYRSKSLGETLPPIFVIAVSWLRGSAPGSALARRS